MGFLAELKRRNVIRMAGVYLVGAWLVVQVAATLLPVFEAPGWVMKALVALLAIGFLAAVVFSWVFELTPDGLKRDADVPASESIAPQTARRMDRMLLMLAVLALSYFAFDKFVLAPQREAALVASTTQALADSAASQEKPDESQSIAVLPFVDMSQGRDQEYFSDGLSEELLNQLAQIPQLRVIARTSSFSFKGKDVDVATIAKALDVAHLLEGSVRKSGTQLRITAQLIRTADSSHLWSQTYDRELADVFQVQDEISREVVSALKLQLLPGKQLDNTQRTRNPAAYEQYLSAKNVAGVSGSDALDTSLAALRRAVELDPGYANAYAALGNLEAVAMADLAESPAKRNAAIAQGLVDSERAIALAPDLPDGYVSRASIRYRRHWDWQGAQADLARALELNPNDAGALSNYAAVLFTLGQREPGLAAMRKAVVSDPLSDGVWSALGRLLYGAGEKAEAKQALARALEISPQHAWANYQLGNLLLEEGKVDEAIAHYQRVPVQWRTTGMAMAEFTRGNDAASQQLLAKMEKDYAIGFAFQIAQVYAWRGEKDQAFAWLERCIPIRDAGMVRLPFDPAMDPLRDDPRFAALVTKMGFPK